MEVKPTSEIDEKSVEVRSRSPHPPGLVISGAPPGFIQQPTEMSPPGTSNSNPFQINSEAAQANGFPNSRHPKVNPDHKVSHDPLDERNLKKIVDRFVNCSDLEDVLLGRKSQTSGVINDLRRLSFQNLPPPPFPRMPSVLPRQRFAIPQLRMRQDFSPIGALPVSGATGLFSGLRVEARPKLPPPPGFEGPGFWPRDSSIQPFPAFSQEPAPSPQPWSPSRQTSSRGQVERDGNQDSSRRKEEKKEEKLKKRALKKKQKKAEKLLERKKDLESAKMKTNGEDLPSNDSAGPSKKVNGSSDSSKENIKSSNNNVKLMNPKNECNESVVNYKRRKQKDKVKKETAKAEEQNPITGHNKEGPRKPYNLKQKVFSRKIILSDDGENILGVENGGVYGVPVKCSEQEMENEKQRRNRKKKKQEREFEQYISVEDAEKGLAEKTLIQGELRINPKNYNECYISDPDNGQDILILGLVDRNRSLEGDIVVVKVKEEDNWQKAPNGSTIRNGKVVHVLERVHHGSTVGTLRPYKKGLFILISRDQRFPLLRIPNTSIPPHVLCNIDEENISDTMYRALLLSWNTPKYANGIIQDVVGKKGVAECETAAIFLELGLNQNPIPEAFNRHLPTLPYNISPEEIESRMDLRSEVIFTIDPSTARDLDDAVSIKKLPDHTFEVGVHISDVTHFLKEGTPLDVEVAERATTVYMVERAYHMLPIALCGLCSLLPGEDKLAISVIMKLDEEGNVLEKKFSRTIINSCAQLAYDHAQGVIEGRDVDFPTIYNDVSPSAIKESILLLNKIAVNRRTKRFESGALKIGQPKVCFDLGPDCSPHNIFIYEIKDSHRLIEEFMLLANELVARKIHSQFPDVSLLRRHDSPKEDMMAKLENSLQRLGIFLDSSCAGSLHASLVKYCAGDPLRTSVLYHLCTKPMQRAIYFCSLEDTHHYALNIDKYTHFTSPIRRYADVVVHRVLTACLGYTPLPPWNKEDVRKFALTSNRKKYAAKRAGDMSNNFFRGLYIKHIGGIAVEAVVIGVNSRSIDVIIPSMAHNIRVYLEKLENVTFEFHDNDIASSLIVKWPDIEEVQVLQVFCPVNIYLTASEKSLSTIEGKLLPPQS